MPGAVLRVTVVGGGVGGMAAALLLSRVGARVTLVERAAGPSTVGGAIALYPNGLAVLYGLGLREQLNARAFAARAGRLTIGKRGAVQVRIPDFGQGLDHALALTRAHLCHMLYEAVRARPGIDPYFGCEVVRAGRDGSVDHRDAARCTTRIDADLVVGADGIGSVVRSGGDFGARLSRTASLAIRALVAGEPFSEPQEVWGRDGIAIAAPVGDGQSYLALSACRGRLKAAMTRRDLAALGRYGDQLLPGIAAALASLESFDGLIVTPIETVACRRWVDGRLVLLGDAAHAMTPHVGQGANSALLDAYALAEELARGRACQQALSAYAVRRRRTVARIQRLSRLYGILSERLGGAAARPPAAAERFLAFIQQEHPARIYSGVRQLGCGWR